MPGLSLVDLGEFLVNDLLLLLICELPILVVVVLEIKYFFLSSECGIQVKAVGDR